MTFVRSVIFHNYTQKYRYFASKILAAVVRYLDTDKEDIVDALLDTVAVENVSSHDLYNAVKNLLLKRNVPMNNIVSFLVATTVPL